MEQLEIPIRRVNFIERCRWRWPLRCREDQRTRGGGSYNFKKKPTSPMPLPSPRQRLLAWSLNNFAFLCLLYHFLASFRDFTWAVAPESVLRIHAASSRLVYIQCAFKIWVQECDPLKRILLSNCLRRSKAFIFLADSSLYARYFTHSWLSSLKYICQFMRRSFSASDPIVMPTSCDTVMPCLLCQPKKAELEFFIILFSNKLSQLWGKMNHIFTFAIW